MCATKRNDLNRTPTYLTNRGLPPGGDFVFAEIVPPGGKSTLPGGIFIFVSPPPRRAGGMYTNLTRGPYTMTAAANARWIV